MVGNDDRCVVGARVHAKAVQVTKLAECSRRYGSNAKTKRVNGTVVLVELVSHPGKARKSCFITADYELGGDVSKRAELNIRSVGAGDAPAPDPSAVPTGTQPVIQNIAAVATFATAPVQTTSCRMMMRIAPSHY